MKAVIKEWDFVAQNVKRFLIQTEEPIEALPGQFVTLTFPHIVDHAGRMIQRSYSLFNWYTDKENKHYIQLCISLNVDGKVTPWLWALTGETEIETTQALGSFTLKDYALEEFTPVKSLIFVCTGTGLVPFVPMLKFLLSQFPDKHILLFNGNRTLADEFWAEELNAWKNAFPNFQYFPIFSRELQASYTGYVHAHYEKYIGPDCHVYVCGWSGMCQEARKKLKELGLTRKQYFFELYD